VLSQLLAYLHDTNHIAKVSEVQVVVAQLQRLQWGLATLLRGLSAAKHYECALVITCLPEGGAAAVGDARCAAVSHVCAGTHDVGAVRSYG
jgi:hypothetical protein